MKKNGFTLVELLAVIIILAIIFRIAVPIIAGMLDQSKEEAFINDAKMVVKALEMETLMDEDFDPTIVDETNIASLLDISDTNFETVTVTLVSDEINVVIVGKEKWNGLTASGTYDNMSLVE